MTRTELWRAGPPVTWYAQVVVDGQAYVFVPTTERLLALNAFATEVWQLCDGTRTADEVVQLLATRHGVPADHVRDVVEHALELLADGGLLSPAAAPG